MASQDSGQFPRTFLLLSSVFSRSSWVRWRVALAIVHPSGLVPIRRRKSQCGFLYLFAGGVFFVGTIYVVLVIRYEDVLN